MSSVAATIDALDDKQAIYQAKLLVQAASDATPAFRMMTDEEITAAVTAAMTAAGASQASNVIAKLATPEALSAEDAGEVARRFLHIFAEAPGGAEVLGISLAMSDISADFGLITGPVLCAFAWLAISGEIDLSFAGTHFRKKGLTGQQQVALLRSILPGLVKVFISDGH